MAQYIGNLGAEGRVYVCRAESLRSRLPLTHQVRLRQLPDLLVQLQDLPVAISVDPKARGVGL
ncbi:hypothetical protein GCM10023321_39370 [Pseudonocardia eucalypti]|uniref:Uncharacterized protein n=1 Tax=Pseudonocardia eucalypti TaxID=648755 RepID=A0ABP9QAD4_9PSEU